MMLALRKRPAASRGLTIVMTTHEPTHALEVADRAVLLHGAGACDEGPVAEMCAEHRLSALYDISMRRLAQGRAASITADYRSIGDWPA